MKYQFAYKMTVWEYFRLSLYYIYGSMIGMCNIIFTVAMVLLTIKMWSGASMLIRTVLLLACSAFPVIQPLSLYQRARKQEAGQKENMQISFDEKGIHISADTERADVVWNSVKKVSRKPGMMIIFSDTTHGYIITDRMLGVQKKEFYAFVLNKVNVL